MPELGQAQVRDGDEVLARSEATGGPLGVLHQTVHGLHKCVGAPLLHTRDHALEMHLECSRQPLERHQAAAHRPIDPAPETLAGDLWAVTVCRCLAHLRQYDLHAPGPRALQVRALQAVHRLHVPIIPSRVVRAHRPAQAAPAGSVQLAQGLRHRSGTAFELRAAHLVHGLARQRRHVKAVAADGRLRPLLLHTLEVCRAHVHAHMADRLGAAAMRGQVLGKSVQRLMITPLGNEEQALLLQIVHRRDVLMALAQAGLVDADVAHAAHVVFGSGLLDVVLDAPPQGLGIGPEMARRLGHRQFFAQAQRQRFKQQREAAALARPGHRHLAGLAAGAAGHAGNVSVQPRLKLEGAQVAPGAAHPFVDALIEHATVRAGHALPRADHVKVDAPLGGIEFGALYAPGGLQPQGCGEQGFGAQAHEGSGTGRWMRR